MLQVQIVILLEDSSAENFQSFPHFHIFLQTRFESFARRQLLIPLGDGESVLLDDFPYAVLEDLVDLVGESLDSLSMCAQTRSSIEEIIPLVHVLPHLLLCLFLLFFFEFGLQLRLLLREVWLFVQG